MIQITLPVAATLLVAFFGLILGFGKLLLSQFEKRMDERQKVMEARLSELRNSVTRESSRITEVGNSITEFMNKLPLEYVRREDWIRFSATIDTKLDRLADLFIKAIKGNG